MKKFTLTGESLSIHFIRRRNIFTDVNITLTNHEVLGIVGSNGSGKTTMLKVLSGILRPSGGLVKFTVDDIAKNPVEISSHIGFVSPYLVLYEEFTPLEHLKLSAKFHNISFDAKFTDDILKNFQLYKRRNDLIKTFSSGMKQRVKYMIALQKSPEILFLDEPYTNLDTEGIETVNSFVENHKNSGGGVLIASNDDRELSLSDSRVLIKN